MLSDSFPIDRPGEDALDLPRALGWFVAACSWVRRLVLGVHDSVGGTGSRVPLLQG